MSTILTRPAAAPPEPEPRWTTPQILKASRAALLALDVVMLAAGLGGIGVHRDAMQAVGKDSAPSIVSAQHIKAALADMDANAANEMLLGPAGGPAALEAYERRRMEAARALIMAAENITYGEAERGPIERLQIGLGTYERVIQRGRDLHARNDQASVAAWREAAKLMDETLLPAADALDKANDDVLEQEYVAETDRSSSSRLVFAAASVVLLAALIAVQIFLTKRMKRVLNVMLAASSALSAWSLIFTEAQMGREQQQLKVAKEDAFTSIRALWRARAVAYQMNGDESRYLLDRERAEQYETGFYRKVARLAAAPAGMNLQTVVSAERGGVKVAGFTGYLAEELNNITFEGERNAAVGALADLVRYTVTDQRVRELEKNGQHDAAVTYCVGTQPGQSNWAFQQFDTGLSKTIDINQRAFSAAVDRGFAALSGLEWKMGAAAACIAALIFLGLAGRIREYE